MIIMGNTDGDTSWTLCKIARGEDTVEYIEYIVEYIEYIVEYIEYI